MGPSPRQRLASHLHGRGVELGPGHVPFEAPPGLRVTYVDRWQPDENRGLFPELSDGQFPAPDIVADFDTDRLSALGDQSQDFIICSHVLEHLAEPIGFVAEIYRTLRRGGTALILLPDRRRTFDSDREPTPLAHLIEEHDAGIHTVDDDHIRDFLARAGPGAMFLDVPDLEWHRRRSIHVHCWTEDEFLPVILYGIEHLKQRWTLVDRAPCEDGSHEFGFVLRRSRVRWRAGSRFAARWNAGL